VGYAYYVAIRALL
jgi:hypothetical protein